MIPSAQEIFDYAVQNNLKITHQGVGPTFYCVRAILSHMKFGKPTEFENKMYDEELADSFGVSLSDISYLEYGFENYYYYNEEYTENPYWKIGREVGELAGL